MELNITIWNYLNFRTEQSPAEAPEVMSLLEAEGPLGMVDLPDPEAIPGRILMDWRQS